MSNSPAFSRALAPWLGCVLALVLFLGLGCTSASAAAPVRVQLQTSMGSIILELFPDKAPVTVANFLKYAKAGFYDGTIFHRVVPGFVIQGGGYTEALLRKPTLAPIKNEADNGLANEAYTVAMARTTVPDSATSQFFINLKDNRPLNYQAPTSQGWGYCVFGKVYTGAGVVDRIGKVRTRSRGAEFGDLPSEAVVIQKVVVLP